MKPPLKSYGMNLFARISNIPNMLGHFVINVDVKSLVVNYFISSYTYTIANTYCNVNYYI